MFLIVGSTGVLGREAARQLLAGGHEVRAMTRDPARAEDLKALGAEVVQGDLIDPPSLARACQGVDGVLASAHQLMGTGKYTSKAVDDTGHRSLIDAARAAGVKHFVYISVMGACPDHPVDFFRTKARIEQYLRDSGLSYTILRPPAFMEWHVHNLLGLSILQTGKATIYGKGDNPTNFIAGRDVARFAVLALTDPRMKGKTIEVGGPDNVTKNQIAQLYGMFSGHPASVNHVPDGMMRVMSPIMRPLQPVLSRLMAFSVWGDTTDQTFDPQDLLKEYPMSMIHVEDFIRERAKAQA